MQEKRPVSLMAIFNSKHTRKNKFFRGIEMNKACGQLNENFYFRGIEMNKACGCTAREEDDDKEQKRR